MYYIFVLIFVSITSHKLTVNASSVDFKHPPVKIEVYSPKGFSVSIPGMYLHFLTRKILQRKFNVISVTAVPNVTLFAFHGKLNEELNGLEAGTWSRDITKERNGRFTFYDRDAELKIGDVLYFWTYTLHKGIGYRHDNGEYVVRDYVHMSIDEVFPTKSVYELPVPEIEIFYPKGFKVSIPGKILTNLQIDL